MNDLSPPDASAAPAATAPPRPVEPPELASAETSAEPSPPAEAGAPSEPSLAAEIAPELELPPESDTPPVAPPPLESSAPLEPLPELAAAPPAEPPAQPVSVSLAPDVFALPLISEDDPCGPDLDLEGDTAFMNFIAATEGTLPTGYYAFNRASIDFPTALQTGEKLLKRTLDIRLLALMAKLSILNRDVAGFVQRVGNIAWLVKEHWEAANPRAEGEDYSGRIAQLVTLDDNAVVSAATAIRAAARHKPRGGLLVPRPAAGDGRSPAALSHPLRPQRPEADDGAGKVHAGEVDRADPERRRDWKALRRCPDA